MIIKNKNRAPSLSLGPPPRKNLNPCMKRYTLPHDQKKKNQTKEGKCRRNVQTFLPHNSEIPLCVAILYNALIYILIETTLKAQIFKAMLLSDYRFFAVTKRNLFQFGFRCHSGLNISPVVITSVHIAPISDF